MSLRRAAALAGVLAANLDATAKSAGDAATAIDTAAKSAENAAKNAPFGGTVYGVGGPDGGTYSDPSYNPHRLRGSVGGGGSGHGGVLAPGEKGRLGRPGSGGGGGGSGVRGIGGGAAEGGLRGATPSGVMQGLPILSGDGKAIVSLLTQQNKLLMRIAEGADRGSGISRDAVERLRR